LHGAFAVSSSTTCRVVAVSLSIGGFAAAFGGGGAISSQRSALRMKTPFMIGRVLGEPVAT